MNQLNRSFIISSLLVYIFVIQAGCANFTFSKPTPTIVPSPTIRPPKPTRTPTSTPTQTALPSVSPTVSPTPTLPPPLDDFFQARLYSSGPKPGWEFSFTLLLPAEIKGNYNALVGDPPKPFICRSLTEYAHPDRLYCSGRIPAVEKQVNFQIIEKKSGQVVFKGNLFIPIP